MKTPEEIKELLANHKGYIYDGEALMADALAYIQQLEEREWELFDLLSSAWFGKKCYFKQDNGTVYSRTSGEYMTFDQAIDEFAGCLCYDDTDKAQVPKWISVEERLPEDNNNVLVYAIGNNENSIIAMTDYTHNMYGYNIEGWHSPWQYFFYEYKITHWMPLPEGPKEG